MCDQCELFRNIGEQDTSMWKVSVSTVNSVTWFFFKVMNKNSRPKS